MDQIKNPSPVDPCSAATGPLCLCFYELVSASSPLGWTQHSIGIAALVSPNFPVCIDQSGRQIDEPCRPR
jgi:hypothetical protein